MKHKSLTVMMSGGAAARLGALGIQHRLVRPHKIAKIALDCGLRHIAAAPERLIEEAQITEQEEAQITEQAPEPDREASEVQP